MNKRIFTGLAAAALLLAAETVFGQEASFLEGMWNSAPARELGMQFLLSDSSSISAKMMVFQGNKCFTATRRGYLGIEMSKTWEGTFKINTAAKTLELIDDFGDATSFRYTLSETEDEQVLKLKSSDGKITSWYKSKT
jgi:hypothetical protein